MNYNAKDAFVRDVHDMIDEIADIGHTKYNEQNGPERVDGCMHVLWSFMGCEVRVSTVRSDI